MSIAEVYAIDPHRVLDALIQYRGGRYAGTARERIPDEVIARALAEYDPSQPLRFSPIDKGKHVPRPACPRCGQPNARPLNRSREGRRRWNCTNCWRPFTEGAC